MLLYLIQHAAACPVEQDPEEGLSEEGKHGAQAIGRILTRLQVHPDYILTSPKKRAQETASLIMDILSIPKEKMKETEMLKAKAEAGDTIAYIEKLGAFSSALFVGHLPSLQKLAKYWCGAEIIFQNAWCLLLGLDSLAATNGKIKWYIPSNLLNA